MLKWLRGLQKKGKPSQAERRVVSRDQHILSRKQISVSALKVLYRLNENGYQAYLVGGGVRDLLLKREPKDFDVATDATPEQVCDLFRNSRMIGRRFRLVHIFFRGETIEVSTLRGAVDLASHADLPSEPSAYRMIVSDNVYGTLEEDAWRRDFTINALYYNVNDFSVIDYTGGLYDLEKRQIRVIGHPEKRFHEDPIRLLRTIRFAAKLNFKVHPDTLKPLLSLPHLLRYVPKARLYDECLKLFFSGHAEQSYETLCKYAYFKELFPGLSEILTHKKDKNVMLGLMQATDQRVLSHKSLSVGFFFAAFLWPVADRAFRARGGKKVYRVLTETLEEALDTAPSIAVPKRFFLMIEQIWYLQVDLVAGRHRRAFRLLNRRYFRAAYDLLVLRSISDTSLKAIAQWWERFQRVSRSERDEMIQKLSD